jgi:hypothetical protein
MEHIMSESKQCQVTIKLGDNATSLSTKRARQSRVELGQTDHLLFLAGMLFFNQLTQDGSNSGNTRMDN